MRENEGACVGECVPVCFCVFLDTLGHAAVRKVRRDLEEVLGVQEKPCMWVGGCG